MHYHPGELPATDRTRIGLHFADKSEIEKELVNLWVMNADFVIPPGEANVEARSTYTFRQDSHLISLAPHMHYRGKDFKYTATYPDGRVEELLSVTNYDFNWQTGYIFTEPKAVPAGTRIDCVAHWDNSAENASNPDSTKTVRFGPQSYDEMMIGFLDYVVDEGVSPMPEPNPVIAKLADLRERYPGEIFEMKISGGPGGKPQLTALHLPREDEGGWYVGLGAAVGRARIFDIVWDGNAFECKLLIPGQGESTMKGKFDPAKETISFMMRNENGMAFPVVGKLSKASPGEVAPNAGG